MANVVVNQFVRLAQTLGTANKKMEIIAKIRKSLPGLP